MWQILYVPVSVVFGYQLSGIGSEWLVSVTRNWNLLCSPFASFNKSHKRHFGSNRRFKEGDPKWCYIVVKIHIFNRKFLESEHNNITLKHFNFQSNKGNFALLLTNSSDMVESQYSSSANFLLLWNLSRNFSSIFWIAYRLPHQIKWSVIGSQITG